MDFQLKIINNQTGDKLNSIKEIDNYQVWDRDVPDAYAPMFKSDIIVNGEVAGKFNFTLFLVRTDDEIWTFYEIADESSMENEVFASELLNKADDYQHDELLENANSCLINSFEISEKYRGNNLGSEVIRRFITELNRSIIGFYLCPTPLQHSKGFEQNSTDEWIEKMNLGTMEQNEEKAYKKLRAFYEELGFKNAKGTNYWYIHKENRPDTRCWPVPV